MLERARDHEFIIFEFERERGGIVVHASHLHAPYPALVILGTDPFEVEFEDAVGEIFLGPHEVRFHWRLGDDECCQLHIAEPLEEIEELFTALLRSDPGDDLEDGKRIDGEEGGVVFGAHELEMAFDDLEPVVRTDLIAVVDMLPELADVEEPQPRFGQLLQPHPRHLEEEALTALLQRDVHGAAMFLDTVLVENKIGERRFHRSGAAGDEHDVFCGYPAAQLAIEAVDVGAIECCGIRRSFCRHRARLSSVMRRAHAPW